MIRIAVTADLHLGMKFSAYPEVSELLVEARFASLERVVSEANRESAELLVIAGDLFDRTGVSEGTVRRSVSILSAFEGALVAVLPGNHDYFEGASSRPWELFSSLSATEKNALLLLLEPRPYDLSAFELDCTILPGPCSSKHREEHAIGWTADYAAEQSPGDSDRLVVGVAHGSIEGISPDPDARYYPMRIADLARARVPVWIVGHTHLHERISTRVGQELFIPGTPEPDGFDCRRSGACWLIDATRDGVCEARSVPTGRYSFVDYSALLEAAGDLETLSAQLSRCEASSTLVKLEVSGTLSAGEYARYLELRKRSDDSFLYFRAEDAELLEEMTIERIDSIYAADSFPHRLLTGLIEAGDDEAVQTAVRLLERVREVDT